jgi:hypothetical protein
MLAVLRKIEPVVFFFAMIPAAVLEGGIVYWPCQYPSDQLFGLTGQWTAAALPWAWSFGALFILLYKMILIFTPSLGCARDEVRRKRKDLVRLRRWAIALIAIQSFTLFLDRVAGA